MTPTLYQELIDPVVPNDHVAALDKATHVSIQHTPGNSLLRDIIFRGQRYEDRGASCDCRDIELYKFGDTAYTRCQAHGLVEIGTLRRSLPSKAVRK